MNLDELERSLIRATQRELAPSVADRERHEAELFARLGGGSGGPTPLGAGSGSGALRGSWSTGSRGGGSALSRAALSQVGSSLRSSRLGMLGLGMIVGAMVGGWFGFGLGRSGWNAAGERAREPVSSAASVALAAGSGPGPDAANAGPGTTSTIASAGLESPSASGMPEGAPRLGTIPDAPPLPGESPASASSPESVRGTGSNRARPAARQAPAPGESSSLAAEVAMLQRARRALNAENGRLALGIVHELDEQFPNGILIEERSATRVLSLCQLEQVEEARGAARVFLERYPASVYAERVRGSCGAAPEE